MARIQLLCAFALAAAAAAAAEYTPIKWTNLYVKWNLLSYLSHITDQGFFKIPLSSAEALNADWVQAASNNITSTWCMQDDPRVCVLYDLQGSLAGMQVSIPAEEMQFKGNPYDVTAHPIFTRNTLLNKDVFTARYYVVDQETLAAGGRSSAEEVGTGLWLQNGGELMEVSRNANELQDVWTRENCVLMMGRHYYYNISEKMSCEDFQPFFLLVDHHKDAVHGIGFQTIGKASTPNRKWFESVPSAAVKPTIPNAPQCLEDWGAQYGIISLHMYFVDRPWFILC